MYYIYEVFDKYRTYTGRARRKEFWHFYLFVGIILFGSYLIDRLTNNFDLATLIIGVVLTPMMSVATRRMHDVASDKSCRSHSGASNDTKMKGGKNCVLQDKQRRLLRYKGGWNNPLSIVDSDKYESPSFKDIIVITGKAEYGRPRWPSP